MKTNLLGLLIAGLVSLPLPLAAQGPHGAGRGHGKGGAGQGKGGGGGPLPAEQKEEIHSLFSNHESIKREVKLTKDGYTAHTTSDDPKVAALLQAHVGAMEKRLDAGFPVRRWDPAFEEFFRHYEDLETKISKIEHGVAVAVKGKTPEAIKVAQNHAGIISGFVKKGEERHHAEHPAVLKGGDAKGTPAAKTGCKDCGKDCQCEKGGKDSPAPKKGE